METIIKKPLSPTQSLLNTVNFLNHILDSFTEYAVLAIDVNGKILSWGENAYRDYGFASDEIIGKNYLTLHTTQDIESQAIQKFMNEAFNYGKAQGVYELVPKSGEKLIAYIVLMLCRDADEKPAGYIVICKNLSNRLIQEEQCLKTEIITKMSHDLRSPLTGIIGFAQLMHNGAIGEISDQQKEFLGDILANSKNLLQLIKEVVDIAKVKPGKIEFNPESVNISVLIKETCTILREAFANNKIELTINVDENVTDAHIDPVKFKLVLYNYLANILKFIPHGGRVTLLVCVEDKGNFRLTVRSTPNKEVPLINVFTQPQDTGPVLAFALIKSIVEAQQGVVGLKQPENQDSEFFIILPKEHGK